MVSTTIYNENNTSQWNKSDHNAHWTFNSDTTHN